jgi:archaellum component FlaC
LAAQLNAIQADFEGLTIRLDEETESAQSARNQLARVQNDYQVLKSKYDKEVVVLHEEIEDIR